MPDGIRRAFAPGYRDAIRRAFLCDTVGYAIRRGFTRYAVGIDDANGNPDGAPSGRWWLRRDAARLILGVRKII